MSERITNMPEMPGEIEQALGHLEPSRSRVSRDQLMFLAGQQSSETQASRSTRSFWPLATAASWLITASIVGLSLHAPSKPSELPVVQSESFNGDETIAISPILAAPAEKEITSPEESMTASTSQVTSHWSDPVSIEEDFLMLGGVRELSAISRHRLQYARHSSTFNQQDDRAESGSVVPPPRATYQRLMHLYLEDQNSFDNQGDLL